MYRFRPAVFAAAAVAAMVCAPLTPAAAGGHGYGHFHAWGLGRGLVGAVVGLATLPLSIASAALAASEPAPPSYAPQPYYPSPAYYPAPRAYYAPQGYYAPRGYSAPRSYYAPRGYYAPRTYSVPGAGYYGSHGANRSGGYGYPHR